MNILKKAPIKTSGACGILAPFIALSSISLSIYLHPWFRWADNALSDLGAIGVPYNFIFNLGLILTGILGVIFTFGLATLISRKMWILGVGFFGAGMVSLAFIGVFPEGIFLHKHVSIAFYLLSLIGMILMGADLLRVRSERVWGLFVLSIVILALTAITLLTTIPYPLGVAIPEIIGAIAFCEFSIGFGARLIEIF
jgi:hypothetical membrane protein